MAGIQAAKGALTTGIKAATQQAPKVAQRFSSAPQRAGSGNSGFEAVKESLKLAATVSGTSVALGAGSLAAAKAVDKVAPDALKNLPSSSPTVF